MPSATRCPARRPDIARGAFVYGKILVPLDGSKLAEAVLPHVQELARRFGSEVTLIRVVVPLSKLVAETMPASLEPSGAAAAVGLEAASEAVKAEREGARCYLEEVAGRLKAQKLKVRAEIAEGVAGEAVVEYAQRQGMDLIAMSTHGRSGLGRLVFGSVADHVLRHAGTPVLLIRSREAEG
jgi:nucleotide-binding universal stress UspA family protein